MKWCNWKIRQVIWDTYLEIGVLVIKMLAPQKIILLEEDVDIVSKRRLERDGIELSNTFIKHFLETERKCAYGFAEENNIPILIINARKDYERGKAFIV